MRQNPSHLLSVRYCVSPRIKFVKYICDKIDSMKKITRRTFITNATLATGFALAVQPISAKVITTDLRGLVAGMVRIPVKDGQIPAYRNHLGCW